ncbi:MAG: DUF5694 domain-containing protein [Ignavibacteriaceae bacterium]
MRKYCIVPLLLILNIVTINAQEVEVLTLGTFHFNFPNRDVSKIEIENQIDVLDPEYQSEIEEIVRRISEFKPTVIAIEVDPNKQSKVDSLYNEYLNGNYQLSRNEHEQIGFRLAKQLGLKKLYCVNDWGELPEDVGEVIYKSKGLDNQKFLDYFYHHPDSLIEFKRESVFKTKGILEELREMNMEENLKKDLGDCLIGVFKYETDDNEFFGVDFQTGNWFNRNLRIIRNIQKINAKQNDKIFVLFGAGHMNILNILFDASPEYKLVNVNDYLKQQ